MISAYDLTTVCQALEPDRREVGPLTRFETPGRFG